MNTIKKTIDGYIARDAGSLIFSDKPMWQDGFYGDGGIWYPTIESEEDSPLDFRVDMHEYMDIPELKEDDSPRHCKITIEVGDFAGEKVDPDFKQKSMDLMVAIESICSVTGKSSDDIKSILKEADSGIEKYLFDL